MVVSMQTIVADFDRAFGALADATRRDIVRRAISQLSSVFCGSATHSGTFTVVISLSVTA